MLNAGMCQVLSELLFDPHKSCDLSEVVVEEVKALREFCPKAPEVVTCRTYIANQHNLIPVQSSFLCKDST